MPFHRRHKNSYRSTASKFLAKKVNDAWMKYIKKPLIFFSIYLTTVTARSNKKNNVSKKKLNVNFIHINTHTDFIISFQTKPHILRTAIWWWWSSQVCVFFFFLLPFPSSFVVHSCSSYILNNFSRWPKYIKFLYETQQKLNQIRGNEMKEAF